MKLIKLYSSFVLLAFLHFSTFAQEQTFNNASAIAFDKIEKDLGTLNVGDTAIVAFHFENHSNDTIKINRTATLCGCTVPDMQKRTYLPGEGGSLKVIFKPYAPGEQKKKIMVIYNDGSAKLLYVKGAVLKTEEFAQGSK